MLACAYLALALLLVGCSPPAPTREFVQQANRLHQVALGGAIPLDSDLNEYFQTVGRRLMDGAHAAAPERTRAAIFSRFETHLVSCDVPNVVAKTRELLGAR